MPSIRISKDGVVRAAKQRLTDDGMMFHMEAAVQEVKLAFEAGRISGLREATRMMGVTARDERAKIRTHSDNLAEQHRKETT